MTFSEQLNAYLKQLQCTASELAEASGLTSASVSRYRNGQRNPDADTLKKLCAGIAKIALQKGKTDITYESVTLSLTENQKFIEINAVQFSKQFSDLITTFGINLNELAKNMKFDPSYLSRIKNGQRIPTDVQLFSEQMSQFLIRKYQKSEELKVLCEFIGFSVNPDDIVLSDFINALTSYLCNTSITESKSDDIDEYLKKLDEFDLNEFFTKIKFDRLKVPTAPFHFPTCKNYYGIEQMKQGELDFFKATALSRSREPLFMNSDMPMADMAQDMEFNKKWMFGIAVCLKKGLHLNMIHNIDRPQHEMILGLTAWIPIYMTGQITPYYFKKVDNSIYHHLNYISGAVALTGECINGHHNDGKYYITNHKAELSYYRKKSDILLSKACSLMDIFTEKTKEQFYYFLSQESEKEGYRYNQYTTLPLYTMSDELFHTILKRNNISHEKETILLKVLHQMRKNFLHTLKHSITEDWIPIISLEEFKKNPLKLSLSKAFCKDDISYNIEEYTKHLEETQKLAQQHKNYKISSQRNKTFCNIQIQMKQGDWVMISKNKSPAIHFIIHHQKMIQAIEKSLFL